MGKLIVIEGVDGCGKATQAALLYDYLFKSGKRVRKIVFPDYASPSSALVKMYLSGEFGKSVSRVSPYAASAFFAVDRFASYQTVWGGFYAENDAYTVADRYVTSNMVHQAAKIKDPAERAAFLDWMCDFEYEKLALPKPDLVIFLDMPPHLSQTLIKTRKNKFTGGSEKDIHEADAEYLGASYQNAREIAEKYGWTTVPCDKRGALRPPEEISADIINAVKEL